MGKMKENTIKIIKIIFIIFISLLLIQFFVNNVFAIQAGGVIDPKDYKPQSTTTAHNVSKLGEVGNTIVGVLQVIGTVLSVAILGVIGIKYMVASADEKAEYKNTLRPYLIGAIMLFGITNLLTLVIKIVKVVL